MPLSFIRWPASTKNGTASSGKLWLMLAIFCTPIESGMPALVMKKMKPAMPVAKATGMPTTMSTTKSARSAASLQIDRGGRVAVGSRARIDEHALGHAPARRRPCCRSARREESAADRDRRGHPGIGERPVAEGALAVHQRQFDALERRDRRGRRES